MRCAPTKSAIATCTLAHMHIVYCIACKSRRYCCRQSTVLFNHLFSRFISQILAARIRTAVLPCCCLFVVPSPRTAARLRPAAGSIACLPVCEWWAKVLLQSTDVHRVCRSMVVDDVSTRGLVLLYYFVSGIHAPRPDQHHRLTGATVQRMCAGRPCRLTGPTGKAVCDLPQALFFTPTPFFWPPPVSDRSLISHGGG